MRVAAIALLIGVFHCAFGQTNTNALVAGDWSLPVTDNGQTVRGRLWVGEGHYWSDPHVPREGAERYWVHAPVYLELEHVVTFGWSQPIQIYFDIFSGLRFEMHDDSGKSIRPQQVFFGAVVPESYWVTLTCDATVRLRADVYTVGNSTNMTDEVLLVGDGGRGPAEWVIPRTSTNDYFLSCTFSPSTNQPSISRYHPSPLSYPVWGGTLKLPRVRVPVTAKAENHYDQELDKKITEVWFDCQKIRPGMTRADLGKMFRPETGGVAVPDSMRLPFQKHQTFDYRRCDGIMIDVDFRPSDSKEERPTDVITKVSKPYVDCSPRS